jgi:rubrerythrin
MSVLIGALIAILVIGVVLYPFIKARSRSRTHERPDSSNQAAQAGLPGPGAREAVYENIRTLQLEHELGAVEDSEYRERLHAYRLEAAAALRDQDRLEQELDRSLEEEIAAARARSDQHDVPLCHSCGQPVAREVRVCPYCGIEAIQDAP